MPRSSLGQLPAMLVRPSRGVRDRLSWLEQLSEGVTGLVRHMLLGEPGDDAMAKAAPSPGRG
jgi:hypothetical protein